MKGVVLAAVVLVAMLVGYCNTGLATVPLVPPVQYGQFCEDQKVSGTGVIDVSTSIIDKKIALEYYNTMAGDGDLELDSEHAYSQDADKLKRNISSVNGGKTTNLNLYENTKMTYSGSTPLTGGKYLNSKEFYGGIGADVQEMFSVNEMEKDQTAYFASTVPYNPASIDPHTGNFLTPEQIPGALKNAGRNTVAADELMKSVDYNTGEVTSNPAHLIGMETKNTFNGTWGTDAKWHEIFYKDIKAHEMFTGKFEADKTIKFHDAPVPEKVTLACDGIDC
ncbi:MAG TPA: hypothetical protein VLY86_03290 [Methanothrix sp.]|nr:hypothetical protein [Methanothrix sp.]